MDSLLTTHLTHIAQKTDQLIELCEALKEQNDLLNLDNQSLKVALDISQKKVAEWKQKVTMASLTAVTSDIISTMPENTLGFKQKINKFVAEIDKCIGLINQ